MAFNNKPKKPHQSSLSNLCTIPFSSSLSSSASLSSSSFAAPPPAPSAPVLLEAMMSGTPVMASRFPSIKGTIIVDDEFGFTFAPNVESLTEAMEAAVKEGPEMLALRGKACRDYAASMFTVTKIALAYERLFLCIKNDSSCRLVPTIRPLFVFFWVCPFLPNTFF
ncbi:hypothetical protein SLE2022_092340 [Rubroshorea leprosula]